ncbi:hypothetical protein PC129_g18772 [Phytophthora cactorum]|uniref:Uncharacterized protein n=1 Tax=Phytophthora cactorum TaxID=29920 RepID=A0A8T1HDV2_9STRA|nr:hypothetical protein PC129_g18772 [Phytophthora cactorum]
MAASDFDGFIPLALARRAILASAKVLWESASLSMTSTIFSPWTVGDWGYHRWNCCLLADETLEETLAARGSGLLIRLKIAPMCSPPRYHSPLPQCPFYRNRPPVYDRCENALEYVCPPPPRYKCS